MAGSCIGNSAASAPALLPIRSSLTRANGGNYAEISLLSTSASSGTMEVHFSMLRGSTGFYVTPIWSHRSVDAAMSMGETRDNIYAGSIFNWMSVDATRNRLMAVSAGGSAIGVFRRAGGSFAVDQRHLRRAIRGQIQIQRRLRRATGLGLEQRRQPARQETSACGTCSASVGYYNGGPMKRELMEHIGTTILNMPNGSHYGGGTDSSWAAGEVWTQVYGPYFIYCNNITNTSPTRTRPRRRFTPTRWRRPPPRRPRGRIAGSPMPIMPRLQIAARSRARLSSMTATIPTPPPPILWVGVVQQPVTESSGVYDFQKWMKPYQFWVKTDANGNFTIPNVIAGANYTLYAFGPGAAGTFQVADPNRRQPAELVGSSRRRRSA